MLCSLKRIINTRIPPKLTYSLSQIYDSCDYEKCEAFDVKNQKCIIGSDVKK